MQIGQIMKYSRYGVGILACVLALGALCSEQANAEVVAAFRDWKVHTESSSDGLICWASTLPKNSEASRKNVRRGDIYLTVAIRPGKGVRNEVSFRSGYPFKAQSLVSVQVGDRNFEMFTREENAWPDSPDEDDRIVEAFRKGAKAVVRGTSSRGTDTADTFSLMGFTASLKKANEICR